MTPRVIAVGSVKGTGGVTACSLAIAAAFGAGGHGGRDGAGRATLIEADPSGGSIIGWCPQLAPSPGLYEAVFSREGSGMAGATQPLGDISVVVAHGDPYRVSAALQRPQGRWGPLLDSLPGTVVIDVGRLHPGSPSIGLLWHADRVVLASAAEAVPVAATLEWAARGGQVTAYDARLSPERIRIVTVDVSARHRWRLDPRRLAADLGPAYVGHLPFDDVGVDLLCRGASFGHRSMRRSVLAEAARALPREIADDRRVGAWT